MADDWTVRLEDHRGETVKELAWAGTEVPPSFATMGSRVFERVGGDGSPFVYRERVAFVAEV